MHVAPTCNVPVQHGPEDQLNYACVQQGLQAQQLSTDRFSIQHVTVCGKATRIRTQVTSFRHALKLRFSGNFLRGWQVGQALGTSFELHANKKKAKLAPAYLHCFHKCCIELGIGNR